MKKDITKESICDAIVRYNGSQFIDNSCKNKVKHKLRVQIISNGHVIDRYVCSSHRKEIEKAVQKEGAYSKIISAERLFKSCNFKASQTTNNINNEF